MEVAVEDDLVSVIAALREPSEVIRLIEGETVVELWNDEEAPAGDAPFT